MTYKHDQDLGGVMQRKSVTADKLSARNELHAQAVVKTADENVDNQRFSFLELDGTGANVQLTDFRAYKGNYVVISCSDSSNTTTVTTKAGTTLDGTNTVATFDAAGETLVLFAISDTQYVIIENIGAVALS